MAELPEVSYGIVNGRFLAGWLDAPLVATPHDGTLAPEAEPLSGWVTFTASAPMLLVTGASPDPVTLFPGPLKVWLDDEGYLSLNDSHDIALWATNDPDANPVDWHWQVTFKLDHKGREVYRAPFDFFLPADTVVDLTVVAPLQVLDDGTIIIQGPPGESASDLINAQGDLITGDAAGDAAILPVGVAGTYLAPEPAAPLGLEWKPFPVPEGGLKVYATMADVDAVRVGEIGTLHVDNISAAFPNLAAVGSGGETAFAGDGPADLVITSQVADYAYLVPDIVVYQSFEVPNTLGGWGESVTARRNLQVRADGSFLNSDLMWTIAPLMPKPTMPDQVPVSQTDLSWSTRTASPNEGAGTIMFRDYTTKRAKIVDPVHPLDIANKQFVEGLVAAVPGILTGSGAPDSSLGEDGDFYIDTDTGAIYGPKLGTDIQTPPTGAYPSGIPLELGAQFTVAEAGEVSAIRLIESRILVGTVVPVFLWDAAGVALGTGSATVTAYPETLEIPLTAPVPVAPGQTYIASFTGPPGETTYNDGVTYPLTGGQGVTLLAGMTGTPGTAPVNILTTSSYLVEPVFSHSEVWPIAVAPGAPAGGGLKVYATLGEAEAVKTAEIGTVHIPDLAAAFPNLAVVGSGAEDVFASTGPGDLVISTTVTDPPFGADGDKWVHQWFEVADQEYPQKRIHLYRDFIWTAANDGAGTQWKPEPALPVPNGANQVPISALIGGVYGYRAAWAGVTFDLEVMTRDSSGRSNIATPTGGQNIANKSYVDEAIAAAPVPPHTHPEIGGSHRFLLDATPPGDPGVGRVSIENAGGQNRIVRVSKTDADGGAVVLTPLAVNDSVALIEDADPTPSVYARGYAATAATDLVTYWEFTAVRESGVGALPIDGASVQLIITMANGAGSSVPTGPKVYASMAELDAVRTAEVGVLHVDSLLLAFPGLALRNSTFAADGPADLVVTSSLSDQPAGGGTMSDLLQTFQIADADTNLRPLRVWRYIRVDTSTGAATATGQWSQIIEYAWLDNAVIGDLFVSRGMKEVYRVPAALSDGQVLTADLIQSAKMRWMTPKPAPIGIRDWNTQTGATFVPTPEDVGCLYAFLNPGPITVQLPATGFQTGAQIHFMQKAATGPITITSDGVLFAPGGKTVLAGQYATVTATKLNYSEWVIEGDLGPSDVWGRWTGTQAEYDAIVTKDPTVLYVVVG